MSPSLLILASGSPRRQELLRGIGLDFEVITVPLTELDGLTAPTLSAAELTEANALLKARAAVQPGRWTLGADTVVTLEGAIFGKPQSLVEAADFLRTFSGRTHEVITGVALIDPQGVGEIFHDVSWVTFHALTDDTIMRYLTEVDVLDKAGGYALQQRGDWLVESVKGSESNIIGLPMERLKLLLSDHGLL